MLQSLLSPNPQPKTSANSLSRTPSPPLVTTVAKGLDALCILGYTSYNIRIRGMIQAVSDAEHREQWCILDHSTTIHQHAPSNISARYSASCYPRAQCDKAGKKTCSITFDQLLYIKEPCTMRSFPELSSVVTCLIGLLPLITIIYVMRYIMFGLLRALCQEFGSANDVRPCIQPHIASSFSIHPLITKLHHAALWDLWRWPAWWNIHGRCCTGPRSGYPGSTIYVKTCVVALLPWIWKPSFGSTFSILSHWFDISSSQNTQEAGPYIWRSPERDCIHFMQVATFIMQNWCIYTIWSCPPRKIDKGKDEFHSYTEEGIVTIRCSDRLSGGVWSDMTTEQVSGRITWECRITENTLAKWCVSFCIHRVSQMRSPMAARLSLPSSIVRHVTWDSPTNRSGTVHVEHRSTSTALWALSWQCCFTV